MKIYNTIYYLLFVLLIMGAFASMAQNSYGLKILGGVAIAFALVFLVQLFNTMRDKKNKPEALGSIELAGLFLLSSIFALRVFYIHFLYVEILFGFAALMLILVYLVKLFRHFRMMKPKNTTLAILILIFHLTIIVYLISLVLVPFFPQFSNSAGMIAFFFLVLFAAGSLLIRNFLIDGENVSAFKKINRFKDKSILIISLFFLFSLYAGFTRIGVLPKTYSDELPQAYFELVNRAESGTELPVNGRYKYQEFKDRYDVFLRKNKTSGQ